jgi:hypothetical protein
MPMYVAISIFEVNSESRRAIQRNNHVRRTATHDFGNSEELLKHLKEKSDDITKVIIHVPDLVEFREPGRPPSNPIRGVGMAIEYMDGRQGVIAIRDAENLLNDGILNRVGIKFEIQPVKSE